MFVMRLTFTKFARIILMHWCVISITSKRTCKQLTSNTQNQCKTCEYGAHKCQVKIQLYRIYFLV